MQTASAKSDQRLAEVTGGGVHKPPDDLAKGRLVLAVVETGEDAGAAGMIEREDLRPID